MKRFNLLVLLLTLLAAGAPCEGRAAGDKIDWHSYESGLARSFCAEMDKKTFKDPAVIASLNRNFIPIRVDSDREQAAASLYRVKGLPDSWFLAESGDVIGHRPGFIPADQLMKILDVVITGGAAK